IDAMHLRHLGLTARQHPLGIMRLDPAPQESRGNREADAFMLHALQVHPREPARINVLAHTRPQPAFDAGPALMFRICHCLKLFQRMKPRLANAGQVSCHGATSSEFPSPDMALPFGEDAAVSSTMSGAKSFPRGQRVLDGMSGMCVAGLGRLPFAEMEQVRRE